jgi:hypothetical protein
MAGARGSCTQRVRHAKRLTDPPARPAEDSHPVLHVLRDAVVAHDWPRVTQAATFALDHEAPQGVARFLHELGPLVVSLLLAPIVVGERRERRFERASQSAERSGLLLRNLVIERDNGA